MYSDAPVKAPAKGGPAVFDYQFNFVIVGESGVGKSCIVLNFAEQKPRKQHQVTIACEFAARIIPVRGRDIKVQIWDTAGQENFRSITRSYYRSSVAAVVVYDVSSRITFEKVRNWMEELKNNAHEKITVILVGNKRDLKEKREVSREEGEKLARELRVMFIETCAFELPSVENMFEALVEEVISKIDSGKLDPNNEHIGIKKGNKTKGSTGKGPGGKTDSKSLRTEGDKSPAKKKCCKST